MREHAGISIRTSTGLGRSMPLNTRENLLSYAEHLIRTRGYTGFSYADLAMEIGIKKASIHYHFSVKEKLGEEIIERYMARFIVNLEQIEGAGMSPAEQLKTFATIFQASISRGLLPLCGALAAEFPILPESLQLLITSFFHKQLAWIEEKLRQLFEVCGQKPQSDLKLYAHLLLSTLEGASFIDWTLGSSEYLLKGFDLVLLSIISNSGLAHLSTGSELSGVSVLVP